MNKIWTETGLELARVVVISVIPVILLGINQESGSISIDWQLVFAVGLIAFIRALDKYLHLVGKEFENEGLKRGLTRF